MYGGKYLINLAKLSKMYPLKSKKELARIKASGVLPVEKTSQQKADENMRRELMKFLQETTDGPHYEGAVEIYMGRR
jgi:hypothetical protein